jgi:hypothetical protein
MPPEESPRPKLRGRKQLLLKLGVFLLLGAIVNVAVAFSAATFGEIPWTQCDPYLIRHREWPLPPPVSFPPHANSSESRALFGVQCTDLLARTDTARSIEASRRTLEKVRAMQGHNTPEWLEQLQDSERELEATQVGDVLAHMRMQTIACGVPWKSVVGARWEWNDFQNGGTPQIGLIHAFEVPFNQLKRPGTPVQTSSGWTFPAVFEKRLVPYRPLWPGFAINTIFYAAILGMPFILRGPVRRFIRIRHHRCPACGYEIAEGVGPRCSECGAALPWIK